MGHTASGPGTGDPGVLVVGLDGTLLRSDMLHESFWSACGRDWRSPFLAVAALFRGRAALGRRLAMMAAVDIPALPYDEEIIALVRAWRCAGRRTVLVTASDQLLAGAVAGHLGIFDEAHGSDGRRVLEGERKGRFLETRFGPGGFVCVGSSPADLPAWRRAARVITVNAPVALRRRADRACDSAGHLVTGTGRPGALLMALRPHQWLKNILLFLPMLAAHRFDMMTFMPALLAFACFSLVASGVYILNDLLDLAADRAHPRKRNRPLAAGHVPVSCGSWMAVGLPVPGLVLAAAIGLDFLLLLAGYYLLSMVYSFYLKRRIVIDICVLAGLYTVRIIAGGVVTDIPLSVWFLAFSIFLFLSLAAVKRQAELVDSAARGKITASGRGYHVGDLPVLTMISISAGHVSVLVLALYVNAPYVAELYTRPEALWGVCAVLLYWITRTVMTAHRGHMHDDPLIHAVRDRVSRFCLLAILVLVSAGAVM